MTISSFEKFSMSGHFQKGEACFCIIQHVVDGVRIIGFIMDELYLVLPEECLSFFYY